MTTFKGCLLGLILASLPLAAVAQDATGSSEVPGRTLEDFFTAAMEHSPSLRIAEEMRGVSEARRRSATGQLLPQVQANASVSENRQEAGSQVSSYRGERYSLQLRQVLFDWATFARRGRASAEVDQYEAEYYNELATLFADVAERYFDVLEAEDALTTLEAELRAIASQKEQVERQYNLRMVPITELYDVQARQATLEAERQILLGEIAVAREALRSTSGISAGELYVLGEESELTAPEGSIEEWSQRAAQNSHQIAARRHALDAADSGVSESRSAYMPQVSLIAQQQRSDLGFDNRPMARTDTGYVGIDVTVPLFAGGSSRANVSEARSQRNIASNELRQVQLEVSDQVRMLYVRLEANAQSIRAAEQTVEAMELAATSRQRGFELGNVTNVEVLDALRDRFRAERELNTRRYQHVKQSLRLRQMAGTLSADDMLEVSSWMEPGPISE